MATSDIKKGPLYVDSTNNRVGIGTASPLSDLHQDIALSDREGHHLYYGTDAKAAFTVLPNTGEIRVGAATTGTSGNYYTEIMSRNGSNLVTSLKADTYGRVTMPSQPAFFAYLNGNWGSWTPNNQTQIVPFDLTYYNIGNHFNVNTGLFTCPVAGNYMFSYGTYVGGQSIEQVWLVKAGVRDITVGFANAGATGDRAAATQVIRCAANDTVGVCPYGSSATTGTVFSNFYHTFFVGALIG